MAEAIKSPAAETPEVLTLEDLKSQLDEMGKKLKRVENLLDRLHAMMKDAFTSYLD